MNWTDRQFQIAVLLLLIGLTAAVVGLGIFTEDESVDKVAYVNLEKVFAEHPARTAAEQTLNKKAAEYKQQIEEQTDELSGSEQKELLMKYQSELGELEEELLAQVTAEVENIIVKTAEKRKVKFVLDEDYILYGGYDLTDEVLTEIDKNWNSEN